MGFGLGYVFLYTQPYLVANAMTEQNLNKSSDETLAKASSWLMLAQDRPLSAAEKIEFEQWLAQSPIHKATYDSLSETWDMMALVELGTTEENSKGNWLFLAFATIFAKAKELQPRAFYAPMVVALTFAGTVFWLQTPADSPNQPGANLYARSLSTEVGQQASFELRDGSAVTLNTETKISTKITESVRQIELLKGEALFDVSDDVAKPFVITSGGYRVTVLGTNFSVRKKRKGIEVFVSSGSVLVEDVEGAGGAPVILSQGDKVTSSNAGGFESVKKADPAQALAWTKGLMVFDDTPLGAAFAEINRYSRRQILVRCDNALEKNISGVFRIDSTEEAIEAIEASAALEVESANENSVVLRCKS